MKIRLAGAMIACACFAATGVSADSLVVTYDAPVASVPTLTEWAMILLGLALAAGAVVSLRGRRIGGFAACGLGAILSFAAFDEAHAQRASLSLNLDGTGSNSLTFTQNQDSVVTVTNTSGRELTSVSFATFRPSGTASQSFRIGSGGTCNGTRLALAASCTLNVNYFMPL